MFESDDFDQVLSQFEFPEDATALKASENKHLYIKPEVLSLSPQIQQIEPESVLKNVLPNKIPENNNNPQTKLVINANNTDTNKISPKHTKRKIINSYFDHKSKRKFPGPAGLLSGGFEENNDESICQMELLSQDVEFSENSLRGDLFDSPLWARLLDDLKSWNLNDVDSIKMIKQQALTGNLKRRKAHVVSAFVDAVDRSATDPLIMMRDSTGSIKGTLHRDAWTTFSQYIASEYCAFILWKPTILTTGSAFKKHYLNITLSNILAIYSSTVISDDNDTKALPEGYAVVYEDKFTVIKRMSVCDENYPQNIGSDFTFSTEQENGANNILDGLDSIFSDEIF